MVTYNLNIQHVDASTGKTMSDDDTDIRQIALRRQQRRVRSRATVEQILEKETAQLTRRRSSTFENKSFEVNNPKSNFISNMPMPLFDDDSRMGRMHVPPVIKCECNNLETFALINTSSTVSTISMDLIERLRLTDSVIPEPSTTINPLSTPQPEFKGKIKYIELSIGSWQQIAQFNVVDSSIPDISLGIDFLRKTQCIVNFEDSSLTVAGHKGERVSFLNNRDVMLLSRKSTNGFNFSTSNSLF